MTLDEWLAIKPGDKVLDTYVIAGVRTVVKVRRWRLQRSGQDVVSIWFSRDLRSPRRRRDILMTISDRVACHRFRKVNPD